MIRCDHARWCWLSNHNRRSGGTWQIRTSVYPRWTLTTWLTISAVNQSVTLTRIDDQYRSDMSEHCPPTAKNRILNFEGSGEAYQRRLTMDVCWTRWENRISITHCDDTDTCTLHPTGSRLSVTAMVGQFNPTEDPRCMSRIWWKVWLVKCD